MTFEKRSSCHPLSLVGAWVREVTHMQSIYKAILRGDRIEWDDDVPEQIRTQTALTVFVTIPDQPVAPDDTRGLRMAEALERLAANGGVGSITDPSQWQRERREDRDLPGRS
ncbi:MAG: hypothetical protein AABO57_00765 [Acidobacteriota bacterium]